MPYYDHLKGQDAQNKIQTVAYGRHVAAGYCAKSFMTGTGSSHVSTIQQILGRGPWAKIEQVFYAGLRIDPAKWKFYPGTRSSGPSDPVQGVDSVFATDVPHSTTAWLRVELPAGVGPDDPASTIPDGVTVIAQTLLVQDYDASGNELGSSYSANPARICADLILVQAGKSKSRINWPAWVKWRDFCDALLRCDYTTLPGFRGFGLTGRYYADTTLTNLIETRVDPSIDFGPSSGAPATGIGTDNYSVRWTGKIRPKYTETYTFKALHDDGVKVWVNGTLVINQWGTINTKTGSTGTIALTRGQFYDIKVEYFEGTSTAQIILKWSSTSQAEEVVPDDVLFPEPSFKPRYEAHPFFNAGTRLDDALRTVLNLCNSTVQDVNGELIFFAHDQILSPAFHFTADNIKDVTVTPRDPRAIRNVWVSRMRDLEGQYLEEPIVPVSIERTDLIEIAGRRIDGDALEFFNSTRWQVYRVLEETIRRAADPVFTIEFTGLPDTFAPLPGDWVTLDLDFLNWTGKNCTVIAAQDSTSEGTADERIFTLRTRRGSYGGGSFNLVGQTVGLKPLRLQAAAGSFQLTGLNARLY